jgi:hypothetical protein
VLLPDAKKDSRGLAQGGGYRFNDERFLLGEHRSQIENQTVVGLCL